MSEQETNIKRSNLKNLSAEEQFQLVKPFLDEGWSATMSLAKAGLSQRRLNKPVLDHPEYKKIAAQRLKRPQFIKR